jgi:CheY-specific phosphatase CheX
VWDDLDAKPLSSERSIDGNKGLVTQVHQSVKCAVEAMIFTEVNRATVLVATLPILKPSSGRLQVVIQERLAHDFASSMYACDAGKLSPQMVEDALAEIINTVAGQLMASILPDDQTFKLGLPEVSRNTEWACDASARSVFLSIGNAGVQVILSGDPLLSLFDD